MTLFTHKYTPKNSHQVFGQDKAIAELRDFIVNYKNKKYKAALLHGPIGNGKTSSVYALARELDYDLLEINSSDLRNEASMKEFLGSSLGQYSLFFRPKIILVDEIDNISGRDDRGCLPALLKEISRSIFPVILTANELEDAKFKPLKKACQLIEFHKLQYRSIAHTLSWVAEQEGIKTEEKAINSLARQADGDLRSALIDLQISSLNKCFVFEDVGKLSDRKRTTSIMNALMLIFKSSSVEHALPSLEGVDMELRDVIFWLDANLPKEYLDAKSLARAYEWLARADVFQGRITRRQHWRFLAYMNDLLTAGISSAKEKKNTEPVNYQPTMRFLRMWQANMKWARRKEIAAKLAGKTHTSQKAALEQMPYLQMLFRKKADERIIDELGLSEEEAEWLRE